MKRFLCFILALLIMSLPVGCNQGGERDTVSGDTTAGSTTDDLEPITFKMYNCEVDSNPDNFESPVAKKIREKTGVTLDIEYAISSEAGAQKMSLFAASGQYPDLVYGKGDLYLLKNIDAVLKLDDLIEQYGPNIKKFYGDSLKRLRWSKEDPGIYYLGGQIFAQENMQPNSGFQLQLGAIKELGYPEVRTLEDFENVIKQYKEKHPQINGQDTIGLSLCGDDWRTMITVTNPACFVTGASDDGEWYIDENLNVVRHLIRPEEKEYFRWLNHMNDIGLLDPESFTQKYDQYKAKIASGRVIALTDARWNISEPVTALLQDGKVENTYGYFPVTLNKDIKYADFQSTGYTGGWGIAITDKCKDPVRAIKFLDWLCTEEAQILTHWGIEGEHYTIENGKRVMKPEIVEMRNNDPKFSQKTGLGKYTYPFPAYGNTVKDSSGQYYEPFDTLESIIANQRPLENEILSKYGVRSWKELYPQADEFPVKPYGAAWVVNIEDPDWKAANDRIIKIGYTMIPAAIMAKPEDFDKKWDEYIKAVKDAGLDEVTEQFEKAIKDRVEMWK